MNQGRCCCSRVMLRTLSLVQQKTSRPGVREIEDRDNTLFLISAWYGNGKMVRWEMRVQRKSRKRLLLYLVWESNPSISGHISGLSLWALGSSAIYSGSQVLKNALIASPNMGCSSSVSWYYFQATLLGKLRWFSGTEVQYSIFSETATRFVPKRHPLKRFKQQGTGSCPIRRHSTGTSNTQCY